MRQLEVATRSIVLVGLMGAGKTCIGRLLARKLNIPFADSDEEVVKAAAQPIADIFRVYGEAAFRDCERRIIKRLLNGEAKVLASGGGAFLDQQTRSQIRARGTSIWLRADLDLLLARTTGRPGRPLLETADPRAVLQALMVERYPIYAEADIVVDTTNEEKAVTVERIMSALDAAGALPAAAPALAASKAGRAGQR